MSTSSNEPHVDVAELRALSSSISSLIAEYETSKDLATLRKIEQNSIRLKSLCISPADAFSDFTLGPLANGIVRLALSVGLFDHLPQQGKPGLSIDQLAKLTETDVALTQRITRGLVAFDIIHLEDEKDLYSHTPLSIIYIDPSRRSWAIWLWDSMIHAAVGGLGPFFDKHSRPVMNPTDQRNAPFTLANGTSDETVFEIVKRTDRLHLLNSAMSGSSMVCAKEAVASFDFASLSPGDNDVVLVDVGGAKGQTIREIQRANPSMKGKFVLQDLQHVLEDGPLEDLSAGVMSYDFFRQEQPILGAAAYLYQRVFHDWNDDNSEKILRSLKPAMAPHSRLLICDVVVQDRRPHPRKVLRDMNMLLVGGLERSQAQWQALLHRAGFVIEKYWGLDNSDNSIIEARLDLAKKDGIR